MPTLKVILVITSITLRTWFRFITRRFDGHRGKAATAIVASTIGGGLWLALGDDLILGASIGNSNAQLISYAGPMGVIAFVIAAFMPILFAMYTPPTTSLDFVVVLLPVSTRQRDVVVDTLNLMASFMFAVLLIWPLASPTFATKFGARIVVAQISVFLGLVAAGVLWGRVLFRAFNDVIARLLRKSPDMATSQIAGVASCILLLAGIFYAMSHAGVDHEVRSPLDLARIASESSLQDHPGLALFLVFLLLALGITLRLVQSLLGRTSTMRTSGTAFLSSSTRHRFPRAIELEVLQWLRYPTTAATIALTFGITAFLLLRAVTGVAEVPSTSMLVLQWAIVSTVGAAAYGITIRHHWLYAVTGAPNRWIAPKIFGMFAVWLLLISFVAAGSVLAGWRNWQDLELLPMFLLEFAISLLIGCYVPVSLEQAFGNAISELSAILGSVLVVFVVPQLPLLDSFAREVMFVIIATGFTLAMFIRVARFNTHQLS